MRPASRSTRATLLWATIAWSATLAPPLAATLTREPAWLLALAPVLLLVVMVLPDGLPPRAARVSFHHAGLKLRWNYGLALVANIDGRPIVVGSDGHHRVRRLVWVRVPHALALPDNTRVCLSARAIESTHAPWDVRVRACKRLAADPSSWPPMLAALVIHLTGDDLRVAIPRHRAQETAQIARVLVDFARNLEQMLVDEWVADLSRVGIAVRAITFAPFGQVEVRGTHGECTLAFRIGRFHETTPAWRGRSEAHVTENGVHTHTIVGPCAVDLGARWRAGN